eukprot:scaffold1419_cov410-Prasinococcus_capsulatus_cf.AAC.24
MVDDLVRPLLGDVEEALVADAPLMQYGVDSMDLRWLSDTLNEALPAQVQVHPQHLLDCNSLSGIKQFLWDKISCPPTAGNRYRS